MSQLPKKGTARQVLSLLLSRVRRCPALGAMAPLYEVIMLTKGGKDGTPQLKKLLKSCATHIWDKGGVLADIRPWGQRELAYRIRKQHVNHYHAHGKIKICWA